ncbi:hypothetical protein [Okeania sp. SIO2B3]|uniref:hypothetical protein n=1 Tax=Okeania sp. SIO2B3 TaxID=2607784 RepID=UPI0013BED656|nr:hypothetical protein [Okeania sp. SIO2B3]NET41897.1 hypothetical protein [Okeania sp. SIO2B3]
MSAISHQLLIYYRVKEESELKGLTELKVGNTSATCSRLEIIQILELLIPESRTRMVECLRFLII